MIEIDPIRSRALDKLKWNRPTQVLVNLRHIEMNLPDKMDKRARRLRTNDTKRWREGRDAALFTLGLETKILGTDTYFALSEEMDYDFVVAWVEDETQKFCHVQLKELPPEDLNPSIQIEDLYDKLDIYSGTDDLVVVVRLNRTGTFNYRRWTRPKRPPIQQLWFLGCNSPDQSSWFIFGDVLSEPRFCEFNYPSGCPTI